MTVVVQKVSKSGTGTSLTIGSGDGWVTPTTGNLVIAVANANDLYSMSGTSTSRFSSIGDQQFDIHEYATLPTSVTMTFTSANTYMALTLIEISSGGFDVVAAHSANGSATNTITTNSLTTTAANDLVLTIAALHGSSVASVPVTPTYDNGVTQLTTAVLPVGSNSNTVGQFIGSATAVTAAAFGGTTVSWTNNAVKVDSVQIAYKAPAGSGNATATPAVVSGTTSIGVNKVDLIKPTTVGATATIPLPTLSGGGNAAVTTVVVHGTAAIDTYSGTVAATATPNVVQGTLTVPTPTPVKSSQVSRPPVVGGVVTIPVPTIVVSLIPSSGGWTWFDGVTEVTVTVDGWFNGAAIIPITYAGIWDGAEVF